MIVTQCAPVTLWLTCMNFQGRNNMKVTATTNKIAIQNFKSFYFRLHYVCINEDEVYFNIQNFSINDKIKMPGSRANKKLAGKYILISLPFLK